ncbi:MAG: 30S ribosomal protein S4 [Candidatus Heimdallarchaeota archaeon LC_3]|uniref:30S ribosomal protein S4 n=1 Tax=uncultured organism TaxID=155900 RepID=A0A0F6PXF2_9ZZZZ|nr:putative 30S ribosomal protein S4 [uncultured organism]OLS18953.1 MAG: 30S ribosomal protein S4 [Candidatus Heimdallarchaeota archaeon LC_3]
MGSAKKVRKKFIGPRHPFNLERFTQEQQLMGVYGLRNKRELYRAKTKLRRFRQRARALLGMDESVIQRIREQNFVIDKLVKIGVLKETQKNLDTVLSLTVENFLERRLQTQVHKKGLTATIYAARNLITHGHIAIKGRRTTIPSYHLSLGEEDFITYAPNSVYRDDEHPLRKELLNLMGNKTLEEPKEEQQ